MNCVSIGKFQVGNEQPMLLIGGMNVIESRELVLEVAEHFVQVTTRLGIPYVFKASFDKANRSSVDSFRGPGLDEGLKVLEEVRDTFGVPVITDIHVGAQAEPASEVCEILQIPAFLARQTDLLAAAAQTSAALHIKKPQFVSPSQMQHVVHKVREFGCERVLVCERGSNFGYDNLVVDMLGFRTLKEQSADVPVTFDVTHALQMRESGASASGGRRRQILELARAGLAVKLAGLFIEAHPNPEAARCDGPSALPLAQLQSVLEQLQALDNLVKSFSEIDLS